jgi:hypothetical protein
MTREGKAYLAALASIGLVVVIAMSYTSEPTKAEPKNRTPVENCMATFCAFDIANRRSCGNTLERYRWCKANYP